MKQRVSWLWPPVIYITVFSALCTYGVSRAGVGVGAAAVIVMLGLVILCMSTERGRWKWWQRILFVPVAFVGAAAVKPLAIAFAIHAMWQSRLFVHPKNQGGANASPTSAKGDVP